MAAISQSPKPETSADRMQAAMRALTLASERLEEEHEISSTRRSEMAEDLARIYRAIEQGRSDAAKHDLDRVLSHLDPAWRTRA